MKRYLGWFITGVGVAVAAAVVAAVLRRRYGCEQAVEESAPVTRRSDDTRQPVA